MGKIYTALGLMSGTSMDGVDASIIKSDGNREFSSILDRYFEYDKELIQKILNIREKITDSYKLDIYLQTWNTVDASVDNRWRHDTQYTFNEQVTEEFILDYFNENTHLLRLFFWVIYLFLQLIK